LTELPNIQFINRGAQIAFTKDDFGTVGRAKSSHTHFAQATAAPGAVLDDVIEPAANAAFQAHLVGGNDSTADGDHQSALDAGTHAVALAKPFLGMLHHHATWWHGAVSHLPFIGMAWSENILVGMHGRIDRPRALLSAGLALLWWHWLKRRRPPPGSEEGLDGFDNAFD
jgi:hypothetical protein